MQSGIHHRILRLCSKDSVLKGNNKGVAKYAIGNVGSNCTVQRITIKSFTMPNVFYNINENNNRLDYKIGLNEVSYVIPVGNYNLNDLVINLNSHFNPDIVINQSTEGKLRTANNSLIDSFTWLKSSTAKNLIGLPEDEDIVIPIFTTYQHVNLVDLSGIKNIYIFANWASMNVFDSTGGDKSISAIVPVTVPFGSTIYYDNNEQSLDAIEKSKVYSQNLVDPEITLRDLNDNILDTNGINYELHYKVYMSHVHES
jgi:hypothetical protein